MVKKFVNFLLSLLIIILMITSQVYAKENTKVLKSNNSEITKGTWLWNTNIIINESQEVIKFMKDYGFNELYLQINKDIKKEVYNKFIENAYKNGIKVYALDGNPQWIFEDKRENLDEFFQWVESYNATSAKVQKFIGIHLDVEPYVIPEWNTNKDELVSKYQNYILYSLSKAKKINLDFAVDIPFWFDVVNYDNIYGKGNLSEWVISKVDGINIMAYRDKAYGEGNIIDICKNEIEFCKNYNKKFIISVETGNTNEGDFITFYQEGIKYMNGELSKVKSYYTNLGYDFGFAVHYLESIINL